MINAARKSKISVSYGAGTQFCAVCSSLFSQKSPSHDFIGYTLCKGCFEDRKELGTKGLISLSTAESAFKTRMPKISKLFREIAKTSFEDLVECAIHLPPAVAILQPISVLRKCTEKDNIKITKDLVAALFFDRPELATKIHEQAGKMKKHQNLTIHAIAKKSHRLTNYGHVMLTTITSTL